jgi:hypothetical protein
MINDSLYTYLKAYAGVTAYVGNRIYPGVLRENTVYPCISYVTNYENEVDTFNQPKTLISPVIEFTCWASTPKEANQLANALRLSFKNFSGTMGSDTVSSIIKVDRREGYEYDSDGLISAYNTVIEFEINYQEV